MRSPRPTQHQWELRKASIHVDNDVRERMLLYELVGVRTGCYDGTTHPSGGGGQQGYNITQTLPRHNPKQNQEN